MAWTRIPEFTPLVRFGACFVCGSIPAVRPGPAYDTGVLIEMEGKAEVCHPCAEELAVLAGCATGEQYAEAEALIEELQGWADNAYAELQDKENTISSLAAALSYVKTSAGV